MKIIGTGCGPGMLTETAIEAIQEADLIVGSRRAIDLAGRYIPAGCEVRIIEDYKSLRSLPDSAVLLSTGDPMLSGLGYLGSEIIPGISSVQYGAAKTGLSLTGLVTITAHGRDPAPAIRNAADLLNRGWNICMITDPSFSLESLAKSLVVTNPEMRIILCENLGYPDERIVTGSAAHVPVPQGGMYILFLAAVNKQ